MSNGELYFHTLVLCLLLLFDKETHVTIFFFYLFNKFNKINCLHVLKCSFALCIAYDVDET